MTVILQILDGAFEAASMKRFSATPLRGLASSGIST